MRGDCVRDRQLIYKRFIVFYFSNGDVSPTATTKRITVARLSKFFFKKKSIERKLDFT